MQYVRFKATLLEQDGFNAMCIAKTLILQKII